MNVRHQVLEPCVTSDGAQTVLELRRDAFAPCPGERMQVLDLRTVRRHHRIHPGPFTQRADVRRVLAREEPLNAQGFVSAIHTYARLKPWSQNRRPDWS